MYLLPGGKVDGPFGVYVLSLIGLIFAIYRFQLNRQLARRENQRLKELDGFKTRLYTNITHEFRTPLTVILGMSRQLELDAAVLSPSKIQEKSSFIRRNGQNLLNLVNQMLDLSKVENNQLKVNYIQGNIVRYVRYITESFYSLANANNVLLSVNARPSEILMDYDPEKMRQILSNLLSNAIKYTPSGGKVQVALDVTKIQNKAHLQIGVSDTGAGIPKSDLPHIFDRFYQAQDKVAKAGGTGIGLALTQELVKLLKGELHVESVEGKGTTFRFHLPIYNESPLKPMDANILQKSMQFVDHPTGMVPETVKRPLGKQYSRRQARLLIIEDNSDVIEYLASCLEDQFRLDFAYNGRAGIEKAFEEVPDIIISDVMMPEKDGFEVCDTLKHDERSSHIPIVLLTAKADVESRIAGLRRGADAYLAKPFHPEELMAVMQNLLELRAQLQARYDGLYPGTVPVGKEIPSDQPDPEKAFLLKLRRILEQNLDDADLSSEWVCQQVGMSRTNLYRKLKALTDQSLNSYIRRLRMQKAAELLLQSNQNVSEIAFEVGFSDPKYFSRVFTQMYEKSPTAFRNQT